MSRRRFALGSAATILGSAFASAQPQPWQAAFVMGSFDGLKYHAGLHVKLASHWKTYWRVPGAGGIPPSINLLGNNLKAFAFNCPLPKRFHGEEGETIGYKDEVLFPIIVEPIDVKMPIDVQASAFIGVCDTVCIPVPLESALMLQPVLASQPQDVLINSWQLRVPRSAPGPIVRSATLVETALVLKLSEAVDDIFVEGSATLGFAAPVIDGDTATLAVQGLKSANELIGKYLKFTLAKGTTGLEQTVMVV